MDIEGFSAQAAVVLGDLAAQFVSLSASAALSGFQEFGRALADAEQRSDALGIAFAEMCSQILRQLPMMFLQAGLQLIANGQRALGLGFIAAAGSSAIISGYVDGKTQQAKAAATEHAQGGVFDGYGRAARAFAAGGTFSNQIVNHPAYFKYGGGLGLMGEAGPEAVMPLKRMPSGNLGVETSSGGANVIVNIINNSGAEVRREETVDAGGNKQIDVIIGEMVNNHTASGKAGRVMGGRYGLRAAGV
jgi:lambda family phage tail tape measure protein